MKRDLMLKLLWAVALGVMSLAVQAADVRSIGGAVGPSDALVLESAINRQGYAEGNPLSYTDPQGLNPKGLPKRAIEIIPLEGGGGGGPAFGGRSPFGSSSPLGQSYANPVRCPPEVQATLQRVRAGESFPHRNDGSVFQNREGLLPVKPDGYYREWVHPTMGVKGPGSQRVVTGQGGEVYYSPDHYRTFIPVP